jgi:hypothetical protein
MNKSAFISYLKDPKMVHNGSIVGLNEVVSNYPYFQSAHLLLSKSYHLSENLNFESSLKKAAAYAANRKQLHSLLFEPINTNHEINKVENSYPDGAAQPTSDSSPTYIAAADKVPLEREKVDHVSDNNPLIEEIDPDPQPIMENAETPTLPEVIYPSESTQEVLRPIANFIPSNVQHERPIYSESLEEESATPKQSILEENRFRVDFSQVEEGITDGFDPLENQILSAAISSSVLLEVSGELPDLESLKSNSISENVKVIYEEEQEIAENSLTKSPESDHSFTSWLRIVEGGSAVEASAENNTHIISEEPNFLTKREKASFYSPTKMARLSVQEDDDLVTETLANIYVHQQHFEKAIKAFEKLQLKYPEKSSYFAGRIKDIQNQLNT